MKEVYIDNGREEETLTVMMKEVFDKINTYNEKHKDNPVHIMVLAGDKKGGASFMIGETDEVIQELMEVVTRHRGFNEFYRKIRY